MTDSIGPQAGNPPSWTGSPRQRMLENIVQLYGAVEAPAIWQDVEGLLREYSFDRCDPHGSPEESACRLSQEDAVLITYADQIHEDGAPPLRSLREFLVRHLADAITTVHLLPFNPYSSDDGFSVIDYDTVDPLLGSWEDIRELGHEYQLMFDAVINHVSRESQWFRAYLRSEPPYSGYFIEAQPTDDLSTVVRPRTSPLLTQVSTASGTRYVWTTFSADQIDLNYANPRVLIEVTRVLLEFVANGASIIRLDAIAYLWKEIGTRCIHLPQTHAVIRFWRAVLDETAPDVLLITETNVPHEDNITYFGRPAPDRSSTDEAQLVYNFTLAPLVLHSFLSGDASRLSQWASRLTVLAPGAYFFNFIASHDGIGVLPAAGILDDGEIGRLVEQTERHGGEVSYRALDDGSRTVYELNVTVYDFLNDPAHRDDDLDIRRFLASQAILLGLAGLPGIYFHSLLGSRNCRRCVDQTGRARSINREKFDGAAIEERLAAPNSREERVLSGYRRLLNVRRRHPAFHPSGSQRVLDLDKAVFALERTAIDGTETVLCLVSVSGEPRRVSLEDTSANAGESRRHELIADRPIELDEGRGLILAPYEILWLAG